MLDPRRELRHTGVVKIRPEVDGTGEPPGVSVVSTSDGHTRRAVVQLLMESGSISAGEIGERLGLSAAGVRRHLDALIDSGDAESHAPDAWRQVGRGRPAKRFRLTPAGRGKLEHRYDDLALAAIRQLRAIGGEEAVRTFARQRIDAILADVPAVGPGVGVEEAAAQISRAFTKAGYATTTTTRVDGPVPGVQICQHHCPVSHVAKEFPVLCQSEQQAIAEVLGTHVQRLATIVNGDCACTTHVPLTGAGR